VLGQDRPRLSHGPQVSHVCPSQSRSNWGNDSSGDNSVKSVEWLNRIFLRNRYISALITAVADYIKQQQKIQVVDSASTCIVVTSLLLAR
jgi:hypothetical protein